MSDTSETDAKATLQNLKVALEEVSKLARTLKEERDEARDQADKYLATLKKHNLDQHGN